MALILCQWPRWRSEKRTFARFHRIYSYITFACYNVIKEENLLGSLVTREQPEKQHTVPPTDEQAIHCACMRLQDGHGYKNRNQFGAAISSRVRRRRAREWTDFGDSRDPAVVKVNSKTRWFEGRRRNQSTTTPKTTTLCRWSHSDERASGGSTIF